MNRQEHLQWAKDRATEYVKRGELKDAYASMVSDLTKHSELEDHAAISLGVSLMMIGDLATPSSMQKFIDGFN